jgi:Copper type II ascorbate-dependent monooxygenase, C-terminal domain
MRIYRLIPLLTIVACSSSGRPPTRADFQHDLVLSMALTVPPGQELHTCQLATLPTQSDAEAVAFSHEYSVGSHHFLVIQTDLDAIPKDLTGQHDCTYGNEPIMQHARGVLYGAQTPVGHFPLPSGVGYHFKAGQVVILQAHYLNVTDHSIDAVVHFGIDVGKPADIHQQAGYMFFYDPFIYVPPMGVAASGIVCNVPSDVKIISASSHYHQRGTGMRVWLDEGGVPAARPFYETHDWQHSPDFHGPFEVKSGSRLRFQCDYENVGANEVFEGPNAMTSEMCVFGGLYYPKLSGSFDHCDSLSVVGTGRSTCSNLVDCETACVLENVDVAKCKEKCLVAGCPGAADLLLRLTACTDGQCHDECAAQNCRECALAKCPTEANTCLTQACAP